MMSAIVIVAMAGTAAVTYAITRNGQPTAPVTPTSQPSTSAQTPHYSPAEQAAAKAHVCKVFDDSTKGQQGQGGLREGAQANLPLVVRKLNSLMAVQTALSPATPPDVTAGAKKYIETNLDLTTAATGTVSVDEVNRLTTVANDATYALADLCGLSH
jgi:hypothetical protein